MIFRLTTSGNFYPKDRESEREKLEKLGFTFKKSDYREFIIEKNPGPEIEINSINELMAFVHTYGEIIVKENSIEIYDNYRE